jgi:hypothetical protein
VKLKIEFAPIHPLQLQPTATAILILFVSCYLGRVVGRTQHAALMLQTLADVVHDAIGLMLMLMIMTHPSRYSYIASYRSLLRIELSGRVGQVLRCSTDVALRYCGKMSSLKELPTGFLNQ